jgi:hypothetical protein
VVNVADDADEGAIPSKPHALDQWHAHDAIQRILGLSTKSLTFTGHSRQRAQARNFSAQDVWRVLRFGSVAPVPDWDEKRQEWIYRVKGRDYENEPLTVKIVIDEVNCRLRVVSAHE